MCDGNMNPVNFEILQSPNDQKAFYGMAYRGFAFGSVAGSSGEQQLKCLVNVCHVDVCNSACTLGCFASPDNECDEGSGSDEQDFESTTSAPYSSSSEPYSSSMYYSSSESYESSMYYSSTVDPSGWYPSQWNVQSLSTYHRNRRTFEHHMNHQSIVSLIFHLRSHFNKNTLQKYNLFPSCTNFPSSWFCPLAAVEFAGPTKGSWMAGYVLVETL